MTTTEEDFQNRLDLVPDDFQLRLVFADWLEEHDDPRAEGYRALGTLRRRAVRCVQMANIDEMDDPNSPPDMTDWIFGRKASTERWMPCVLPHPWYDEMLNRNVSHPYADRRVNAYYPENIWFFLPTRAESEDHAALAFSRLSGATRDQIVRYPDRV